MKGNLFVGRSGEGEDFGLERRAETGEALNSR